MQGSGRLPTKYLFGVCTNIIPWIYRWFIYYRNYVDLLFTAIHNSGVDGAAAAGGGGAVAGVGGGGGGCGVEMIGISKEQ